MKIFLDRFPWEVLNAVNAVYAIYGRIWKKIPPSPCDKAEAQLCKLMLNCKARER